MSSSSMVRAALIPAPHRVAVVEVEPHPLTGTDARVAIRACGICGSDLHTFEGRHPFVSYPVYPGHELSGIVVDAGQDVPRTWLGQRVSIEPSLVCGECENCRSGHYNICDRLRVMGFQAPGGMREEFVVPADRLVPLPAAVTDEQGACVEPVAVAVHAARLCRSLVDRDVLVLGAGTIGLLVAQIARDRGARRVVLTDQIGARRALAARLDLDGVPPPADGPDALLSKGVAGRRPDVAFECVGVEATLRQAIEVVRKGGDVIVVGVFGQDAVIPAGLIQDRELQIRGSLMYTRPDFEEAVRLIAEGRVQVDPLISHRMPLQAAEDAFARAGNQAESLKVLVMP
ncbi:MAG TPA: alcohol dehydrogenase catalytic domain-containing protein [bacterium]|nr:alcohol dehydrogenase catalytic domain-containing protein [bacterium]